MQVCRLLVLCGLALAVCCASIEAGAATVPPLTVRATNVTMPLVTVVKTSGGATSARMGSSQVKVTGIPDATGTLTIECQYSGPIVKAKIPRQCGPVGLPGIPVTAGQIYTGSVIFVPYDQGIVPGLSQLRRTPAVSGRLTAATLGLRALMFGFGFRHNKLRSLALAIFVVCVLAGALESSASGRKSDPMTRGTYQYTIFGKFQVEIGRSAGT